MKLHKVSNVFLCIALFVCLQVFKPIVFMEIYRYVFSFDPHLYSNWQLYKMVWFTITKGSLAAKVTLSFLLAEVLWVLIPIGVYQLLRDKSVVKR